MILKQSRRLAVPKSDRTDTTNAESSSKDKSRPNTKSSSDHGADSGSTWKQRTKSDDHANSRHSDST